MYQQHLNEVRAAQIQQDRRREAAVERSLRVSADSDPADKIRGVRPSALRRLLRALPVLRRRHAGRTATD